MSNYTGARIHWPCLNSLKMVRMVVTYIAEVGEGKNPSVHILSSLLCKLDICLNNLLIEK